MIPITRFPIEYKRTKGPNTPNFAKLSDMLNDNRMSPRIPIERENVKQQHGAVGIKMSFVCDMLEELERVGDRLEILCKGRYVYIKKKEFYDFIFDLDIFIFELYSILDYFAIELTEIFKLEIEGKRKGRNKKRDVKYFSDIVNTKNLNPTIMDEVKGFVGEDWFKFFHHMRNRVVHRLPINLFGLVLTHGDVIEGPFLPDEPLNPKSAAKMKLKPLMESRKWLEQIFSFVDRVCYELGKEMFDIS